MQSREQRLEKARRLAQQYSGNDESVVDHFILERRQAAAEETFDNDFPDQFRFELSEDAMAEFVQQLSTPPTQNSKLDDLFSRQPVWDTAAKSQQEQRKALPTSIENNQVQPSTTATDSVDLIRRQK